MSRLAFIPQMVRVDSTGLPYAGAKCNAYLTTTTTPTDTWTDNARTVAHANPIVADSAGQWAAIYLDPAVTYRFVITKSDDSGLDDVDPVSVPLTAADIILVDTAGDYTATDLEAALTEVVTDNVQKAGGTMTGDLTMNGADVQMADNELVRAEIKDFSMTHTAPTSSSNAMTLDLTLGNSFKHTLTENTTITISNPAPTGKLCSFQIKFVQGAGSFTVTWPASVLWPGGTPPVISVGSGAIDKITCTSDDSGTSWEGSFAQAYA